MNIQWTDKKPNFNKECIVLCRTKIKGEWDYSAFRIKKLDNDIDNTLYWGWLTIEGEEYGDLKDLEAQEYLIIPI